MWNSKLEFLLRCMLEHKIAPCTTAKIYISVLVFRPMGEPSAQSHCIVWCIITFHWYTWIIKQQHAPIKPMQPYKQITRYAMRLMIKIVWNGCECHVPVLVYDLSKRMVCVYGLSVWLLVIILVSCWTNLWTEFRTFPPSETLVEIYSSDCHHYRQHAHAYACEGNGQRSTSV